MKPVIKQMWQDAFDYAFDVSERGPNLSMAHMNEVALEKFAELVVRDCADHILNCTDRYRKEYFAHLILDQYGIKE